MLLKITFFALAFNYAYCCTTPDNQTGKCIRVKNCPKLNAIFSSQHRSHEENKFFAQSFCNLPIVDKNNPDVCCEELISEVNKLLPTSEECGNSDVVYNDGEPTFETGDVLQEDRYPWMGLIEYKTKADATVLACGGTLINNRYILTAAHCVVGHVFENEIIPKTIRFGEHKIDNIDCSKSENSNGCNQLSYVRVAVEKIIPHPKYDPNDSFYRNNIALIRFSKRVQYSNKVKPICLSDSNMSKSKSSTLILAGWGTGNGSNNSSLVKMHKKTNLVPQQNCNNSLSINGAFELSDVHFCAGDDGMGNCVGDGGSGAVQIVNGKYYLAGIVSIGPHVCHNAIVPDVFTNVYQYKNWIAEQVMA